MWIALRPFVGTFVSMRERPREQALQTTKRRLQSMETSAYTARRKVEIDFLYLDLEVCTRCRRTDANLESAVRTAEMVLKATGVEVIVNKTLVDTEMKARELGFVSSPTVRINGQDIAFELKESGCESCGSTCARGANINCRVWIYRGVEYTEAPKPMILEAILKEVFAEKEESAYPSSPTAGIPDNLKRFYAAKRQSAAVLGASLDTLEEQETCCEAAKKDSCCAPIA
jgi:Domain of unknown function (DUF2703)